jgi:hypothetical protein
VAGVGAYKPILAPSPFDRGTVLQFENFVEMGVHPETLRRLGRHKLATAVAQYYGNVQQGMLVADVVHLFRGIERELMHLDNEDGDEDVYVFSWRPRRDWEWDFRAHIPRRLEAATDRVFVVQARLFEKSNEQGLVGEVLHWTWIAEDSKLKGAPEDWQTRYAEFLWTKHKPKL